MRTTDSKVNRLFIVLAGFFLTNALIAEHQAEQLASLSESVQ